MDLSSNFRIFYSILKRNFKIDIRYKLDSISTILRPIIGVMPLLLFSVYSTSDTSVFLLNTGTSKYIEYIALSFFFIYFITNSIISASISITQELQQGTFEHILFTTDNTLYVWICNIISNIILQFLNSVFFYIFILIIFNKNISINSYPILIITIIVSIIVSIGIGIALSGATIKTKLSKITFMSISILTLLAGSTYPITILPTWIKNIAFLNPLTYCIDLIRYSVLGTKTYFNLNYEIIIVTIYSLFLLGFSIYIYNKVIYFLKNNGDLSNY